MYLVVKSNLCNFERKIASYPKNYLTCHVAVPHTACKLTVTRVGNICIQQCWWVFRLGNILYTATGWLFTIMLLLAHVCVLVSFQHGNSRRTSLHTSLEIQFISKGYTACITFSLQTWKFLAHVCIQGSFQVGKQLR